MRPALTIALVLAAIAIAIAAGATPAPGVAAVSRPGALAAVRAPLGRTARAASCAPTGSSARRPG